MLTMGPFSDSTELSPLEMEQAVKCEIGKVFDVKVLKKSDTGLVVSILPEKIPAFLPLIHLSDYITNCKLLWNNLQQGDIIPRVACLKNTNGQITLCRKQALISAFEDGWTVKKFSDIQSGMMMTGWVKSIMAYGVFVEFPYGLFGLTPKSALCDKFVTNTEDHFVLGQTVVAKVTNTDEEKKRVLLSLKLSDCCSDDVASESFALLKQYFQELIILRNALSIRGDSTGTKTSQSLAKLLLGQKLRLTVQYVNDDGSILFSGGEATVGMTVLASPFHVGDVSLVPGQNSTAVVLYVNGLQSKIFVSVRPEILKIKDKKLCINDRVSSIVQHVAEEFAVVSLVETGQLAAVPVASHYNDTYRFDSEKLTVGQTICVSIKTLTTGDHGVLLAVQGPVASRTTKMHVSDGQEESSSTEKHSLSFGDVVTGTVKSVKPTSVLVTIADKLVGFIHASQIFDETPIGTFPTSKLKMKQKVTAKVIGGRDIKTHRFLPISHPHFTQSFPELSIRPSVLKYDFYTSSASTEEYPVDLLCSYKPGQNITCFVWKYNTIYKCLDVEISPEIRGRIDNRLLSVSPKILKYPEKHFKIGQSLSATVISADTTKMRLRLSLIGAQSPAKGAILLGTVKKVDPRTGLTIALPFGKIGNASLVDLNDSFSDAPLDNYSAGNAVRCCVLSIDDHRIHVSLRQSRLNPKGHGKVVDCEITCIEDVKEGQLLRGYVTSVCDQGVFVSLSATIAGRVQFQHVSQFFDKQHSVFETYLPVGRLLTAKVLRVDSSNEHVELSLLPNDTGNADVIPDSLGLSLQEVKKNEKRKGKPRKLKEKRKRAYSESEQTSVSKKKKSRVIKEENDSGVEVYFREEEQEEPVEKKPKAKKQPLNTAPRLQTSSSFSWDVNLNTLKVAQQQKEEGESSDCDEEEGHQSKTKKKTKKVKETEKKQAEKELSKIEAALMDSTRQPQTADDFDRLVLSSPNSSILWLQYMAFHLHATEIEKARAIAERALKTISFREEQEKLNVWVAFLNLENMYGTEDTLMKVFERAVQYNEPLKVFMQLGDIYSKCEKFKQADDLYNTMLKRFRKEKCVWVKYATYLLKQGQMEEAHRLLQRALKCLPDKEHVDVISKFAQLEFHLGDVERAKTIFESTLSNYPKRTDLWSVYIDMMIKHGSQKEVRNIFERVIHLSLAAKRMKFFFKRYLDYEKKHGSQERVQAVKEKALEYVESKRSLSES